MKFKKPDLDGFWAAILILTFVIGGFIAVYWIGRLVVEIPVIGCYLYMGDKINDYFLSGFVTIFSLSIIISITMIICKGIADFIDNAKAKRRKK